MEVKITSEKILEAASKCSTAKATLEVLFPEVFKEDIHLSLNYDLDRGEDANLYTNKGRLICKKAGVIQVRGGGKYDRKGFYLSPMYGWKITTDDGGALVLLPTKKIK